MDHSHVYTMLWSPCENVMSESILQTSLAIAPPCSIAASGHAQNTQTACRSYRRILRGRVGLGFKFLPARYALYAEPSELSSCQQLSDPAIDLMTWMPRWVWAAYFDRSTSREKHARSNLCIAERSDIVADFSSSKKHLSYILDWSESRRVSAVEPEKWAKTCQ